MDLYAVVAAVTVGGFQFPWRTMETEKIQDTLGYPSEVEGKSSVDTKGFLLLVSFLLKS